MARKVENLQNKVVSFLAKKFYKSTVSSGNAHVRNDMGVIQGLKRAQQALLRPKLRLNAKN
jgi:hypothetical protein